MGIWSVYRDDDDVCVCVNVLFAKVFPSFSLFALAGLPLVSINGKKVKNLAEAARLLNETPSSDFTVFRFETDTVIVLPAAAAKSATADVLAQHAIPAAMSADLLVEEEKEKVAGTH